MTEVPSSRSLNGDSESWEIHIRAIYGIVESIRRDGWQPTAILGIARGGLVPAAVMAYALGVKELRTIQIRHYTAPRQRLQAGPQPVDEAQYNAVLTAPTQRLLIVDDIIDTGATLKLVKGIVDRYCEETRIAAIYARPKATPAADWCWKVSEEWIQFPWEYPWQEDEG